ncbi:MAG: indole-3-glycerol phosphate synthase TrpC [Clostridia bacterium]|jgi:indole-3-glycerol phosphate synthase|nr:indole-3-glycerol phosphate synthase TrpC [Clostridia bacterium]
MILDDIAAFSKKRVAAAKEIKPLEKIKEKALGMPRGNFRFENTLKKSGLSFICEVKKASPSKGIISENFPYLDIAEEYEKAGADCVSCLTEPKWFLGSDYIFKEIREKITLPMIRKDFTVDEYQIYEAKCMGADAVLLICALLDTETVEKYIGICDLLGISALVEAHDEKEIKSAADAGARIIGVNNRNLKNFTVDFSNAQRLREEIPENVIYVAESGVKTADDVHLIKSIDADAVLIGEAFMKSENKKQMLDDFRRA